MKFKSKSVIGLEKEYATPILSHYRLGMTGTLIWISFGIDCIQMSFDATLANDLYSTFVLDLTKVFCFLVLQESKIDLKNMRYPIDLGSIGDPDQSTLESMNMDGVKIY